MKICSMGIARSTDSLGVISRQQIMWQPNSSPCLLSLPKDIVVCVQNNINRILFLSANGDTYHWLGNIVWTLQNSSPSHNFLPAQHEEANFLFLIPCKRYLELICSLSLSFFLSFSFSFIHSQNALDISLSRSMITIFLSKIMIR